MFERDGNQIVAALVVGSITSSESRRWFYGIRWGLLARKHLGGQLRFRKSRIQQGARGFVLERGSHSFYLEEIRGTAGISVRNETVAVEPVLATLNRRT